MLKRLSRLAPVLAATVLLVSCGNSLKSMSKGQVMKLCMAAGDLQARPSGSPVWDDDEWAWSGTVKLSAERPEANFTCVVTGKDRQSAQAIVRFR